MVFANIEDKDRVFEGGPYFYATARLYMRPWKMYFVPERETFIGLSKTLFATSGLLANRITKSHRK